MSCIRQYLLVGSPVIAKKKKNEQKKMWVTSGFILKTRSGSRGIYPGVVDAGEEREPLTEGSTNSREGGVEPRTCGSLGKVASSAAHQPLWTSHRLRVRRSINPDCKLTCFSKFLTMRTNVWIYQALLCVVVTIMDTGKPLESWIFKFFYFLCCGDSEMEILIVVCAGEVRNRHWRKF